MGFDNCLSQRTEKKQAWVGEFPLGLKKKSYFYITQHINHVCCDLIIIIKINENLITHRKMGGPE